MSDVFQNHASPAKDPSLVIKTFKELYKMTHIEEVTEQRLNELQDACTVLNSLMPGISESNLFEIDDLLYPGFDMPARDSSVKQPSESIQMIIEGCLNSLITIVGTNYIGADNPIDFHPVVWMAYLQTIEHSSGKEFEKGWFISKKIFIKAHELLQTRNVKQICTGLKILRSLTKFSKLVYNNGAVFHEHFTWCVRFIFKLKTIPQACHPNSKRITTWISQQSEIIIDSLKSVPFLLIHYDRFVNFQDLIEKEKFIDCLTWLSTNGIQLIGYPFFHVNGLLFLDTWYFDATFPANHVYEVFMLARNANQKFELLKYFYEKVMQDIDRLRDMFPGVNGFLPIKNFQAYCSIFKYWVTNILKYIRLDSHISGCTHGELKEIARCSGFNIETYMSVNLDEEEINDIKMSEKLSHPVCIEDEWDYTINKFLVFDEFMSRVQVVAICYAAILQSGFLKKNGFHENIESWIFRNNKELSIARGLIRSALLNPSKEKAISWRLEIMMQKCPYVFLPKYCIHLMPDLLRVLNGEKVDEITIEDIFFALGSGYNDKALLDHE